MLSFGPTAAQMRVGCLASCGHWLLAVLCQNLLEEHGTNRAHEYTTISV